MKNKKIIILFAIILIVFPNIARAKSLEIKDMPNNWSKEYLEYAVEKDLLKGSNGYIRPEDNLTRSELATIVNRILGTKDRANINSYKDMNNQKWYYKEMEKAVAANIFNGSNGKLNPEKPITREETFVVMARVFNLIEDDDVISDKYNDGKNVSSWAEKEINALVKNGYIKGDKNNKLNLNKNITRAEYSVLIKNLLGEYIVEPTDIKDTTINSNVLVNNKGLNIYNATINGDLLISEGVDISKIEFKNLKLNGRLILRSGANIDVKDSTIKNINILGNKSKIRLDNKTEINKLISNKKITVDGSGKIKEINLKKGADKSSISAKHYKVNIENGVDNVYVNDIVYPINIIEKKEDKLEKEKKEQEAKDKLEKEKEEQEVKDKLKKEKKEQEVKDKLEKEKKEQDRNKYIDKNSTKENIKYIKTISSDEELEKMFDDILVDYPGKLEFKVTGKYLETLRDGSSLNSKVGDVFKKSNKKDRVKYTNHYIMMRTGSYIRGAEEIDFIIDITYPDLNNATISGEKLRNYDKEAHEIVNKFIEKEIKDKKLSDAEKVLIINNYLGKTADYNYEGLNKYNVEDHIPYGVLVNKKGVCESYAKAFKLIADKAELESVYVTGKGYNRPGSSGEDHAWNMVKINNQWYSIDTTWNDIGKDVRYDYFLKSDDFMNKSHKRDNEYNYPEGNGKEDFIKILKLK